MTWTENKKKKTNKKSFTLEDDEDWAGAFSLFLFTWSLDPEELEDTIRGLKALLPPVITPTIELPPPVFPGTK